MKNQIKNAARAIAYVLALPSYLLMILLEKFFTEKYIFEMFSQAYSLIPGLPGDYLRCGFYRLSLKHCDPSAKISFGTIFSQREAEIFENVYIGKFCIIGKARISKDTLIASRVSLLSGLRQHNFTSLDIPIRQQEGEFTNLIIGEDCWIGEGAIVGADIEDQVVIAAGSFVASKIKSKVIARGNPAKVYKER